MSVNRFKELVGKYGSNEHVEKIFNPDSKDLDILDLHAHRRIFNRGQKYIDRAINTPWNYLRHAIINRTNNPQHLKHFMKVGSSDVATQAAAQLYNKFRDEYHDHVDKHGRYWW